MIRKMFEQKYQTDPQFREFADSVQGKSPQQVCQDYGVNYDDARNSYDQMSSKWRG